MHEHEISVKFTIPTTWVQVGEVEGAAAANGAGMSKSAE